MDSIGTGQLPRERDVLLPLWEIVCIIEMSREAARVSTDKVCFRLTWWRNYAGDPVFFTLAQLYYVLSSQGVKLTSEC